MSYGASFRIHFSLRSAFEDSAEAFGVAGRLAACAVARGGAALAIEDGVNAAGLAFVGACDGRAGVCGVGAARVALDLFVVCALLAALRGAGGGDALGFARGRGAVAVGVGAALVGVFVLRVRLGGGLRVRRRVRGFGAGRRGRGLGRRGGRGLLGADRSLALSVRRVGRGRRRRLLRVAGLPLVEVEAGAAEDAADEHRAEHEREQ